MQTSLQIIITTNPLFFSIISYLDFSDILSLKQTSKHLRNSITHKLLRQYALSGCITPTTRRLYYMSMIDINKIKCLITKELLEYNIKTNIYKSILSLAEIETKKEKTSFTKVIEEIGRDICRTFYTEKFVKGNGKEMIKNILTAIAFVRPEIGYCQGMNFIAGALISYIDDEKISFYIFLSFIDDIELNLLYLKNMPDYSIRSYQLNYYISKFFPKLTSHFQLHQINPDIFFSKWILAIFSSYLTFDVLCKVWDVFIIDKWKAIFKFSMSFLMLMQDKLLTLDLQEFCLFFRTGTTSSSSLNFKDISMCYNKFKITNTELDELREEFFMEEVKAKLNDPTCEWDTDQNDYVNGYKSDLNSYLQKISSQSEELKDKIESLNKKYIHAEENYNEQSILCSNLKLKVQLLIESINGLENVLKNIEGNEYMNGGNNARINVKDEHKYGKTISKLFKKLHPKHSSDYEKLQKKRKDKEKELDKYNKIMLDNFKLLDKKKYALEKIGKEKEKCVSLLQDMLDKSEKGKKELIKNLSQKLKLSAKFVSTNKY